jgi:signal transduction histidine kinase
VLVVCDRSFEKETFGAEDVQVFETLAAHAGVAVERARSVSDLTSLAAELEVARDAALSASEAKSMFLANMSHEIRTPLTTVLATGELLGDTPLNDLQLRLLERMSRNGGQLLSLVEALLDFSRIEAGHAVLHPAAFDLHALVKDLVEAQLARAAEQGVTLEWELDPRVPQTVVGDRTRVCQVLTNLIDNALKFTQDGRVHVHVGLVDHGSEVGDCGVQFTVADTGIGISEDDQASIFESFSQVDGSTTRQYGGAGLGLAIGKALTELMDGTIALRSELGVGSTFTVRLPLVPTDLPQPTAVTNARLTA